MVTVQAMRPGGEILGYIKLPLTEGAGQRIRHEAATLEQLRRSHLLRQHVPEVLFAGEWHDRYTLFQSAGEGTPGPARFHGVHTRFLHHLRRSSAVRRSGGSLVQEASARWAAAGEKLNAGLRDLGRDALRLAGRQLRGTEIACGIWHGDFAPWNTRVCDGRLFVFNWECAEWDMPIWWDLFHFDLQVECLLRRNSGIDLERVDAPSWNGLYILYLLRSVCRCAEDESGADAIEFRRKKLTRLVAAQPGLRALDPIHVGGGY
jgi:hypothetical protein